jgi:hypothetical protein
MSSPLTKIKEESRPRIIEIKCCGDCPFNRHDNGGGFCEPFDICEKYSIILIDDTEWINLAAEIHKDCRLPKK